MVANLGHEVLLPCDLGPQQAVLVLWYKGDQHDPLYRQATIVMKQSEIMIIIVTSYDAREKGKKKGWSDESEFGGRAHFDISSSPAVLRVKDIEADEGGVYRCRVDYKSHPTRNSLVNLTVTGN